MKKFVAVLFATTAAMVFLFSPHAYGGRVLLLESPLRAVLDINGSPLKARQPYTMLINSTMGLGVTQINENCSLNIGPQALDKENTVGGTRLLGFKIIDLRAASEMIFVDTLVSIELAKMQELDCLGSSPVWQVVNDADHAVHTIGEDRFMISRATDQTLPEISGGPSYLIKHCGDLNRSTCQNMIMFNGYYYSAVSPIDFSNRTPDLFPLHVRFQPWADLKGGDGVNPQLHFLP